MIQAFLFVDLPQFNAYSEIAKPSFKTTAIGPKNDRFDYEFKESTVWVMAEKMVEDYE